MLWLKELYTGESQAWRKWHVLTNLKYHSLMASLLPKNIRNETFLCVCVPYSGPLATLVFIFANLIICEGVFEKPC